jgi:hypothetical protein
MKTLKQNHRGFLALAALSVTFMLATAGPSFADGSYRHDQHGYWDGHHHYHNYDYYHHHRGYWDERNGVRIFINL